MKFDLIIVLCVLILVCLIAWYIAAPLIKSVVKWFRGDSDTADLDTRGIDYEGACDSCGGSDYDNSDYDNSDYDNIAADDIDIDYDGACDSCDDSDNDDVTSGDTIIGGGIASGGNNVIDLVTKTRSLVDKFLTSKLAPSDIVDADRLARDLPDIDTITPARIRKSPIDAHVAKTLLDAITLHYINTQKPGVITSRTLKSCEARLKAIPASTAFGDKPASVLKAMQAVSAPAKPVSRLMPNEGTRTALALRSADAAILAGALNASSSAASSIFSSSLAGAINKPNLLDSSFTRMALDDCNRERQQLRDKVEELRRDITRANATPVVNKPDDSEHLRNETIRLQGIIAQLEARIARLQSNAADDNLRQSLQECNRALEAVRARAALPPVNVAPPPPPPPSMFAQNRPQNLNNANA